MSITSMDALELRGRRVLIRQDLNVPIEDGRITSAARIDAALGTIRLALERGAAVLLMSHLGRPAECRDNELGDDGRCDDAFSLAPVAAHLSGALGREVAFSTDYLRRPPRVAAGGIVLLENVRFNRGEKADDDDLARRYAALCDVFVMDAFGAAHRAQASTCGVARHAPAACAGPLLLAELSALSKVLESPRRPLVAIVGGAKVSSKLGAIQALARRVDRLIPGGGIANTFLKAAGRDIGRSLFEPALVGAARDLLRDAAARGHA
ncbi:MAG: phosphoglycerate kinase, partial [bacterium]